MEKQSEYLVNGDRFATYGMDYSHEILARGGHSNVKGYQARPKIHVIRVVFQDQALYARTAFRGAKT